MNLQESIRRILKEESSRIGKINSMIDKIGFLNAVRVVGGYKIFKQIYGEELTKEKKVEFIKNIVKQHSTGEGVLDLFEFDIFIELSRDTDIRDIYDDGRYMSRTYEWDEEYQEWEMDNFYERYHNLIDLPESRIDAIITALERKIK